MRKKIPKLYSNAHFATHHATFVAQSSVVVAFAWCFFQLSFRSCLCICAYFTSILFIAPLGLCMWMWVWNCVFFKETVDYLCTLLIVLSWIYILFYVSVARVNAALSSLAHSILCNSLLNLFPSFSFIGMPDVYYIWPVCVCVFVSSLYWPRQMISILHWAVFTSVFSTYTCTLYVLQSIFCLNPMILSTKLHSSTTIATLINCLHAVALNRCTMFNIDFGVSCD